MKETRNRIILIIFGVCLSIVIAEILLSIFNRPHFYHTHSFPPQFAFVNTEDKDVFYVNIPSQDIRFVYDGNPRGYFGRENEVDHITNSWGFRGKEFFTQKPADTFRIAFLGDSFTFGEGVKFEDTYPEMVSSLLRQRYEDLKVNFESYNFGVGGYNTSQSLFILKTTALNTSPDMVVLGYTMNDAEPALFFKDANTGMISRRTREAYIPEGMGNTPAPDKLAYKLRLLKLFWQLQENMDRTKKTVVYYNSLFLDSNSGWNESRQALRNIAALCQQKNIPCYVILFPVLYQLNDRYPFIPIHTLIRKETESSNVTFIDLFPYLKGSDAEKLWVHPTDQHPNEKVHEVAARAIVEKMLSDKVIDRHE